MNLFVVPLTNNRFDVSLDGVKLVSSAPAIHILQLIPALKLLLPSLGYKLTKEDHYHGGGRLLTFEKGGTNAETVSEKRSDNLSKLSKLPTKSSLSH